MTLLFPDRVRTEPLRPLTYASELSISAVANASVEIILVNDTGRLIMVAPLPSPPFELPDITEIETAVVEFPRALRRDDVERAITNGSLLLIERWHLEPGEEFSAKIVFERDFSAPYILLASTEHRTAHVKFELTVTRRAVVPATLREASTILGIAGVALASPRFAYWLALRRIKAGEIREIKVEEARIGRFLREVALV